MPQIELKYIFADEAELLRHMGATVDKAGDSPKRSIFDKEGESEKVEKTKALLAEITDTDVITADTDADGLAYDPEIHATPKSMTADGLWRAKRGQSEKAAQVRAAFKAAGGSVVAPVATATAAPVMPGMPVTAARAPEPISHEKLLDKTMGMMERDKISVDGVIELYKVVGIVDPAVLETNESMRAALFNKLCEIEPELV